MPPSPAPSNLPSYAARLAFVVELAERLHVYGTTAQRLEGALDAVAASLQLDCEPWSNPTGLILTFSDPTRPPGETDTTRVIRLPPGDTDLAKLCEVDRIAEEVMAGRLDLASGHAALRGDELRSDELRSDELAVTTRGIEKLLCPSSSV